MTQPSAIVPDGGIRPGFNETGTAIVAKRLVKHVAGSVDDPASVALATDGDSHFGVTMEDIAAADRGDVQVLGRAIVTAGAAIANGVEFTANASGKAIAAVSGDYIGGITCSAGAADGDDIMVELNGPSGGRIKA